jgi:hypothetical protein
MKGAITVLFHIVAFSVLAGCATPKPSVKYYGDNYDSGAGYRFVIPRTVIKVSGQGSVKSPDQSTDAVDPTGSAPKEQPATGSNKGSATRGANPGDKSTTGAAKLTVAAVPVSYDENGKTLPVFSIVDATSSWRLASTSITNVKYADQLIIQSIGTEVTDNRKDAIGSVISAIGLAGKLFGFAGGGESVKCLDKPSLDTLADFVIDKPAVTQGPVLAPGNTCWGYEITGISDPVDAKNSFPVGTGDNPKIPLDTAVGWFAYPVCKAVTIAVFPCASSSDAGSCTKRNDPVLAYVGRVSVADGTQYRKIPLAAKGKLDMHSDYCSVDATSSASPSSSDWSLLSEAIKDVNNLKQKGSSTSKSSSSSN